MNGNIKLHFAYITGILVAIIIILLTVQWGGIQGLVNYLTFALTLTSLVLSLLAIVYAFFSNASNSRQAGMLERASKEISEASDTLLHSTTELEKKVGDVPSLLQEMGTKVEATRAMLESYSNKFAEGPGPEQVHLDRAKMIERMGRYASHAGLVTMAVAHSAFEAKKAFNMQEVAKDILPMETAVNHYYAYGWLMALDALGFLSVSANNGVWMVKDFDATLWNEAQKSLDRAMAKNNPEGDRIKETLQRIKKFFS